MTNFNELSSSFQEICTLFSKDASYELAEDGNTLKVFINYSTQVGEIKKNYSTQVGEIEKKKDNTYSVSDLLVGKTNFHSCIPTLIAELHELTEQYYYYNSNTI